MSICIRLRSLYDVSEEVFYKFYMPSSTVELRHDMQLMDQHYWRLHQRYVL